MVYLKATPPMENILPSIEGELLPICMQTFCQFLKIFFVVFYFILFFQFYDVGKVTSHNHPKENLAEFGYKTYREDFLFFIFQ
jgi:hypothetical protein